MYQGISEIIRNILFLYGTSMSYVKFYFFLGSYRIAVSIYIFFVVLTIFVV